MPMNTSLSKRLMSLWMLLCTAFVLVFGQTTEAKLAPRKNVTLAAHYARVVEAETQSVPSEEGYIYGCFVSRGTVYGYVEGNPVNKRDLLGLASGVTIWQPVGWGESSFGHVSTDINGTTYSFGPGGMKVMPTSIYANKNGFRDGMEVMLNLNPQQEASLKSCLSQPQGKYNVANNNCGSPVQDCLKSVGINTESQLLPVSLGNKLLDMGITNGIKEYSASRPSGGLSAPWAR
jgi:hypothetical protein